MKQIHYYFLKTTFKNVCLKTLQVSKITFLASLITLSVMPTMAQSHWVPTIGQPFPDLQLIDQNGKAVQLSKYKGKVLLIEPIGMSCSGCQALSGGHKYGPYKGVRPQPSAKSIEEYVQAFGKGIQLTDDRLVFMQIIFFNTSMKAPQPSDIKGWIGHFDMNRSPNFIVLGGTQKLANPSIRKTIPGFFLVDKNFILRHDAAGHKPKSNLFTELIPQIKALIQGNSGF